MISGKESLKPVLTALVAIVAGILFFSFALGENGNEKDSSIFKLKDIKPGMKGYGLTVFSGREVEKFDVEVISVIHQFLPKQDVILVRCSHPVLEKTGIIAGMSGSPIYFDGKLAGALAYAWRFAKEPVAGITPIEEMLPYFEESSAPSKKNEKNFVEKVIEGGLKISSQTNFLYSSNFMGKDYWDFFDQSNSSNLSPLTVPLSGNLLMSNRAFSFLSENLKNFFLQPVPNFAGLEGGNISGSMMGIASLKKSGKVKNEKLPVGTSVNPGEGVGIQLARGDLDLTATGTITAVKGKKFLAFGHPMFNFGRVDIPASSVVIHHSLASMALSFKMSQPEKEIGSLVLDKQGGILIDSGRKAKTIPVELHLKSPDMHREEIWNFEVLHQIIMTPSILRGAVIASMDKFSPDVEGAVVDTLYKISVHGHKPLVLKREFYQQTGTLDIGYCEELYSVMTELLRSDFEPVSIERVDAEISVNYSNQVGYIGGAYFSSEEVEEGEKVEVFVIVVKMDGKGEIVYRTQFVVPQGTAGKQLTVSIEAGNEASPQTVTPYNLDDVLENLSKRYPSDSIVVTLQIPAQGVSIRGKMINNLPYSALNILSSQAGYLGTEPEAVLDRNIIDTDMVISGKLDMKLKVRDRKGN